jgi:hypothetical protein
MLAAALIGAFGVAGAFTFNACTFLPLLIALLFAIPNAPAPSHSSTVSIYDDIREGLKFVWTSPGTRRLTIMVMGTPKLWDARSGQRAVFEGEPCSR